MSLLKKDNGNQTTMFAVFYNFFFLNKISISFERKKNGHEKLHDKHCEYEILIYNTLFSTTFMMGKSKSMNTCNIDKHT